MLVPVGGADIGIKLRLEVGESVVELVGNIAQPRNGLRLRLHVVLPEKRAGLTGGSPKVNSRLGITVHRDHLNAKTTPKSQGCETNGKTSRRNSRRDDNVVILPQRVCMAKSKAILPHRCKHHVAVAFPENAKASEAVPVCSNPREDDGFLELQMVRKVSELAKARRQLSTKVAL